MARKPHPPQLVAFAFLALVVLWGASAEAATPSADTGSLDLGPAPALSQPVGECEPLGFEASLDQPRFTPVENGAVWTSHNGCHAQITCDSNCIKQCSGTVCSTGPNWVECDGVRKYCPTCNVSEYPGYPQCFLRLCPWCVCVNLGGDPVECCEYQ